MKFHTQLSRMSKRELLCMKFHTEIECYISKSNSKRGGFVLGMWKQCCVFERIHQLQLFCEIRMKPYITFLKNPSPGYVKKDRSTKPNLGYDD